MAGGDVASPSNATFTEQPEQGGVGNKFMGLLRKYWYVALALALIAGFLIYNYVRSSSAQVGTSSATAGADPGTSVGTTGTGSMPDASSILDLLAQSYQAMADAVQSGAVGASSTSAALPGSPSQTLAQPAPATQVAAGTQAATITHAQAPTTPPATPPPAAPPPQPTVIENPLGPITVAGPNKTSGTIAQRNTSGVTSVTSPTAQSFRAATANIPIFGKAVMAAIPGNPTPSTIHLSGRAGGNLGVGGPPPSGPPAFSTHVTTHEALTSSGTMYASKRNVRPE